MLDQVFETRTLLLFGHVAAAILLLGPLTAAASRFPAVVVARGDEPGDAAVAAELHRSTRTYGTAAVVVPVLGLVLAAREQLLSAFWVQASLGLLALGALVLFAVVLPEQVRLLARLRRPEPELLHASDVGRLRGATGAFALTWVLIVLLMVAKPS